MQMPLLGDSFPRMEVQTTQGPVSLPGAYAGKWFLLFSHPADFTPVCTTEFVAFQKRYGKFKDLNTELIGLSVDQVFSHIKWIDWIKDNLNVDIKFPIITGTEAIAAKLGLIHPGKGTNMVRAVFIVDPKGIVRAIMYYPQELGRNMDEFLRMIKGFQIADRDGVAIPANWPDNELIGDDVIVPPPNNVDAAKKIVTQYDCYDWWFCHKKQ
ncbi:MAG TPA: peroxiredoxin [Candidatus Acetothermia bacterium]|nr:peroxiredoxin [Candidatus Acetothermia bacterium]